MGYLAEQVKKLENNQEFIKDYLDMVEELVRKRRDREIDEDKYLDQFSFLNRNLMKKLESIGCEKP